MLFSRREIPQAREEIGHHIEVSCPIGLPFQLSQIENLELDLSVALQLSTGDARLTEVKGTHFPCLARQCSGVSASTTSCIEHLAGRTQVTSFHQPMDQIRGLLLAPVTIENVIGRC